jgi:hypothetical protein
MQSLIDKFQFNNRQASNDSNSSHSGQDDDLDSSLDKQEANGGCSCGVEWKNMSEHLTCSFAFVRFEVI